MISSNQSITNHLTNYSSFSNTVSYSIRYGKIIIAERFLPPQCRTINPISMGGIAGGNNIANNILFCFPLQNVLLLPSCFSFYYIRFVITGEKYIYHGILFKFAVDLFNIYDGDQYAMKAANHELKSVIRYYNNIDGIHVPLMALVTN